MEFFIPKTTNWVTPLRELFKKNDFGYLNQAQGHEKYPQMNKDKVNEYLAKLNNLKLELENDITPPPREPHSRRYAENLKSKVDYHMLQVEKLQKKLLDLPSEQQSHDVKSRKTNYEERSNFKGPFRDAPRIGETTRARSRDDQSLDEPQSKRIRLNNDKENGNLKSKLDYAMKSIGDLHMKLDEMQHERKAVEAGDSDISPQTQDLPKVPVRDDRSDNLFETQRIQKTAKLESCHLSKTVFPPLRPNLSLDKDNGISANSTQRPQRSNEPQLHLNRSHLNDGAQRIFVKALRNSAVNAPSNGDSKGRNSDNFQNATLQRNANCVCSNTLNDPQSHSNSFNINCGVQTPRAQNESRVLNASNNGGGRQVRNSYRPRNSNRNTIVINNGGVYISQGNNYYNCSFYW